MEPACSTIFGSSGPVTMCRISVLLLLIQVSAQQRSSFHCWPLGVRSPLQLVMGSMSKGLEVPVGHLAHAMESIAVLPMMISECQI